MTDFVGSQNMNTQNSAYGVGCTATGCEGAFNIDPYYDEIHLSKQKLDEHYEEIPASRTQRGVGTGSRNKITSDSSPNPGHQVLSVPNPVYGSTQSYSNTVDGVSATKPVYSEAGGANGCEISQQSSQEDVYIVMQPNGRAELASRYTMVTPRSGTCISLDEAAI